MSNERQYRPAGEPWVKEQLATIESTGTTRSVGVQGMEVVVVEILGWKSGLWRKVPLMRVEHDGVYALVASQGGAPTNPTWYRSVVTNPDVTIMDGTDLHEATARLATDAERAQWWPRCVQAFPPYAQYQTKTDRVIPVLLAEPR